MKKLILTAMAALLFVGGAFAQPNPAQAKFPQPVKETYLYAVKGSDSLYLDRIYDPEKITPGKKIPTMIYMFGGGWAYGARGGNYKYLTDIGVQVITIDYRLGLKEYGYGPSPADVFLNAIQMALDDETDAMAFTLKNAEAWNVDTEKVMLSGSSAGAITTLMSIYDICNSGPYSKKFPEGWMPAGYIGYAGAIINTEKELTWAKKPCPMMFFHGSGDTTVAFERKDRENGNVFGPKYILSQLHEMQVPNYLYVETDADHILSYKAFSGYNFNEIQTFVQKFVIQGLPLEMKTEEYNMKEPSHLPGMAVKKRVGLGGSGPYKAVAVRGQDAADYTVYRPVKMDEAVKAEGKLPLVIFSSGGCDFSNYYFRNYLTEIASHGYVVCAVGYYDDYTPEKAKSLGLDGMTDTEYLVHAIDVMKAANESDYSELFQCIDMGNIIAVGQSCGGGQALTASIADQRITGTIALNSGFVKNKPPFPVVEPGSERTPEGPKGGFAKRVGEGGLYGKEFGGTMTQADLAKLHAPVLYLNGGKDDVAYPNANENYDLIKKVQVSKCSLPVGHMATYLEPNGGIFSEITLKWLDWQTKGKTEENKFFLDKKYQQENYPEWEINSKN